jgi:hypothetical protein
MLNVYNYADFRDLIYDIACVHEARRMYNDLHPIDVDNSSEAVGSTAETPYHNIFQNRNKLGFFRYHLEQLENKVKDLNSFLSIIKHHIDSDYERIKTLSLDNVVIKRNMLVMQRRISSAYCSISSQINAQIIIENQLEECKRKVKELKQQISQLKKQAREGDKKSKKLEEKLKSLNMNIRSQRTHLNSDRRKPSSKLDSMNNNLSSTDNISLPSSLRSVQPLQPLQPHHLPQYNQLSFIPKMSKTINSSYTPLCLPTISVSDEDIKRRRLEYEGGANTCNNLQLNGSSMIQSSSITQSSHPPQSQHISIQTSNGNSSQSNGDNKVVPDIYIGRHIKKLFRGHGWFTGRVISYSIPYYRIQYEDGDEEEMRKDEVEKYLVEVRH